MEDEWILLKIRRQFSKDESVAALLKIVSELEMDIGVLKSEKDELRYLFNKAKHVVITEEFKTKKAWAKDELVTLLTEQLKSKQANNTKINKSMVDWRNKYFSLLAKQNKDNV